MFGLVLKKHISKKGSQASMYKSIFIYFCFIGTCCWENNVGLDNGFIPRQITKNILLDYLLISSYLTLFYIMQPGEFPWGLDQI